MIDLLRDPVWQGVSVITTLLLGFVGFYYSGKNRIWLYIFGAVLALTIGIAIGFGLSNSRNYFPIRNTESIFSHEPIVKSYKGDNTGIVIYDFLVHHYSDGLTYELNYILPPGGDNYAAGLAFVFGKPINLPQYEFLEIHIILNRSICNLILKDTYQKSSTLRIGEISSDKGITVTTQGDYQIIKISTASHFQDLNPTSIVEIDIEANTSFVRGGNSFTIIDILFVK